jgi:hypothetical protein
MHFAASVPRTIVRSFQKKGRYIHAAMSTIAPMRSAGLKMIIGLLAAALAHTRRPARAVPAASFRRELNAYYRRLPSFLRDSRRRFLSYSLPSGR